VEVPSLSDLLVIEFPSEAKAEGVREILLAMHKEYLIEPADTIIAVAEDSGRVKLNQLLQPVARSAVSGMPWSSLICLLFMMPSTNPPIDVASGVPGNQVADLGIDEDFTRQAARTLRSGNATLFLLIREATTDKVLAGLRGARGVVMCSSFE
jgi:uncharacterized membrane protein